jgi:hypothetical protein
VATINVIIGPSGCVRHRCLSDTVTGTNIVATIVSDFFSLSLLSSSSSDSLTFLPEGVVLGS